MKVKGVSGLEMCMDYFAFPERICENFEFSCPFVINDICTTEQKSSNI